MVIYVTKNNVGKVKHNTDTYSHRNQFIGLVTRNKEQFKRGSHTKQLKTIRVEGVVKDINRKELF